MNHFITITDGHEEGISLMIPIEEGMEVELLKTIEHLKESGEKVEVSHGSMNDEDFRENMIKSIMYGEDCTRELAIEILEDN